MPITTHDFTNAESRLISEGNFEMDDAKKKEIRERNANFKNRKIKSVNFIVGK